jgi:hypothetical protein
LDYCNKIVSDYLAIYELTVEVGTIVQKSINEGHDDLSSSDIEHILKITSNVTERLKSETLELTV